MTLLIALLLLEMTGHGSLLAYIATTALWGAHLVWVATIADS